MFMEHPKKEECQPGDAREGDFGSLRVRGLSLTRCRPSAVKVVATREHFSKNTKPVGANRSTSLGAGSRQLLSPRGDREDAVPREEVPQHLARLPKPVSVPSVAGLTNFDVFDV